MITSSANHLRHLVMKITFTIEAHEVPTFLEVADGIYHDGGCLAECQEEATSESSTFTIHGNHTAIFALGQAYQATSLEGLANFSID